MPEPKPARRTTVQRKKPTTTSIVGWFTQWLNTRDEKGLLEDREATLRLRQLDYIIENGEKDANGHIWLDLPQTVEYKDRNGKVFKYTALKRQRALRPAQPTPDPELAEELLKKKGLWLTEKHEKALRDLAVAVPYANITIEVDADAVAGLLFNKVITDDEYEATLVEQKEVFSFIPAES